MRHQAQTAQEGRTVQVLAAAVTVSILVCPVPERRGHIDYTDAVNVKFVCEEAEIREEEGLHLRTPEAEHRRISAAVLFVECASVKIVEARFFPREAYTAPVHEYADAGLMQRIDKLTEARGRAELRAEREIRARQIAERCLLPGREQRHEQHMCVVHLAEVSGQGLREFLIGSARRKACKIQFIDVDGLLTGALPIAQGALFQVGLILPGEGGFRCRHRGSTAALRLDRARIGIRTEQNFPRIGLNFILIECTCLHARQENRKNTAVAHAAQLMHSAVPVIEVADYGDTHRIRCKDREAGAGNASHLLLVCAQKALRRRALTGLIFPEFSLRKFRQKAVRIFTLEFASVLFREHEAIAGRFLFPGNQTGKKAALIDLFHGKLSLSVYQRRTLPFRKKCLHEYSLVCLMRSQNGMRVSGLRVNNLLDRCPVHYLVKLSFHAASSCLSLMFLVYHSNACFCHCTAAGNEYSLHSPPSIDYTVPCYDQMKSEVSQMARFRRKKQENNALRELLSWVQIIVVAAVIAFILNNFLIANSRVPTGSMENTIMAGDRVIGSRLSYRFGEPQRGDVIIFRWPDDEKVLFVKRIIGMPGDKVTVRDGKVYLNDSETPLEESYIKEPMVAESPKSFTVPEGAYFCMGDNRNESMDARYWKNPYVYKNKILAKVLFRYWPGIKGIH